ncbi:muconate/chloromuconate family cycloisomerase [Roseobacter sp. MH60115]|uniref:muconate/chloromuconate family cycloisomerase n=1 Tax=Roseobacter sp. MH60115 TaxID=2785324 RepID=UPI0018A31EF3|nr:muconate/chloromuconate family cycloisomerase [Roseobacter sp. MH60115]
MPKIDRVETFLIDIPTIRGHVLSMTTMTVQSIVLVRLRFEDGSDGWGEGTTIGGMRYCAESPESIRLAIDSYIAPAISGLEGDNINAALAVIETTVRGNPIARAAVEMALWDGLARRLDQPIAQLFGGALHDSLPVAWTLASGNSQTDITEAQQMIETGRHNIFKLKIGKRPVRDDVAHVAAIKASLGDKASVRVDVNQSWSLSDARWGLAGLQDVGCDLVEQPIPADQISNLKALTDSINIAVMADEALQGPKDALRLAADRSADVFAVKIAQSGGLKRAAEVVAIARSADIGLYAGTMLESGVSTATALQLFATVRHLAWGTELFGPLLFRDEILQTPLTYQNFSVTIPEGPGSGVEVDISKIEFYRRDRTASLHAVQI